jgi:hypothetical protein
LAEGRRKAETVNFSKKSVTFAKRKGHLPLRSLKASMTATLTYTLVLAAIYFGIKAVESLDKESNN